MSRSATWLNVRIFFRVNAQYTGRAIVMMALASACATNQSASRVTVLANADRAAKLAIQRESQLDVAKIPARSFAVLPFNVAVRDSVLDPLAYGLAALLTTDLAVSPSLSLVERMSTDALVRETRLVDKGVLALRDAPRVGRLMGARRLLMGDVARAPNGNVRLSARIVDVVSGTVVQLLAAEAPLFRILDAEKVLALQLLDKLGIALTPAERTRVERKQSVQLAALVAYGKGVQADAAGDADRAVKSYQEAVRIDGTFEAARAQTVVSSANAAGPRVSTVASSLSRVLDFGIQSVNTPVGSSSRPADAADAPLAASGSLQIIFVVRVTP